ncbi:MAG: DUF169 domain-containing protein [Candidatus Helarchaeota archaeon]|nr:DUF169 domain-containing protein [Candidatus Helarchaeota archaeon]
MASNNKNWQNLAESFVSVLELKGQPIAVTYTDKEIEPTIKKGLDVCATLKKARDGEIIRLNKVKCTCPGGRWHLGLAGKMEGLEKILVKGEKLWATVAIARQSIGRTHQIAPPPLGLAKYIIFSPLNKAELRPDVVAILCNPWQASRLIFLADYHGYPVNPQVTGSLCWSAITYPLVTGNLNVTMGDPTARRHHEYDPNELIVSIPYRMVPPIIEAMEYSTAGKGKPAPWFERAAQQKE